MKAEEVQAKIEEAKQRRTKASEALQNAQSVVGLLTRHLREWDGRLSELMDYFDRECRNPVALGTVLHGIDISKLDWQTRLMVQQGNRATIQALGGSFEPPAPKPEPPPKASEPEKKTTRRKKRG